MSHSCGLQDVKRAHAFPLSPDSVMQHQKRFVWHIMVLCGSFVYLFFAVGSLKLVENGNKNKTTKYKQRFFLISFQVNIRVDFIVWEYIGLNSAETVE